MNSYEVFNEVVVFIVGNLTLAQAFSMNIISAKNVVCDCIKVVLLAQIVINIVYITLQRSAQIIKMSKSYIKNRQIKAMKKIRA